MKVNIDMYYRRQGFCEKLKNGKCHVNIVTYLFKIWEMLS